MISNRDQESYTLTKEERIKKAAAHDKKVAVSYSQTQCKWVLTHQDKNNNWHDVLLNNLAWSASYDEAVVEAEKVIKTLRAKTEEVCHQPAVSLTKDAQKAAEILNGVSYPLFGKRENRVLKNEIICTADAETYKTSKNALKEKLKEKLAQSLENETPFVVGYIEEHNLWACAVSVCNNENYWSAEKKIKCIPFFSLTQQKTYDDACQAAKKWQQNNQQKEKDYALDREARTEEAKNNPEAWAVAYSNNAKQWVLTYQEKDNWHHQPLGKEYDWRGSYENVVAYVKAKYETILANSAAKLGNEKEENPSEQRRRLSM